LIFKTITIMYSIGNILMAMAILSAMPLSLAVPATNDAGIGQYDPKGAVPSNSTTAITQDNVDADDVLDTLEAAALRCGLESKRGKSCTHSDCPAAMWCTANRRKRTCRMKGKKGKGPFGCENCKCRVVRS
jgi:hypothetical protein